MVSRPLTLFQRFLTELLDSSLGSFILVPESGVFPTNSLFSSITNVKISLCEAWILTLGTWYCVNKLCLFSLCLVHCLSVQTHSRFKQPSCTHSLWAVKWRRILLPLRPLRAHLPTCYCKVYGMSSSSLHSSVHHLRFRVGWKLGPTRALSYRVSIALPHPLPTWMEKGRAGLKHTQEYNMCNPVPSSRMTSSSLVWTNSNLMSALQGLAAVSNDA